MKKGVKIVIIILLGIFTIFGLDILKIFDPPNCSNIDRKIAESNADFEKWIINGYNPHNYDRLKFAHAVELIEIHQRCIILANR